MNIPTPTAADKTGALYVTRANYDRFIAAGVVYQSAGLLAARESGRWVFCVGRHAGRTGLVVA
jgi:hypothetical protein